MRLPLAEDVEIAAGAELGEKAGPALTLGDPVEAREKRVVDGLEDLALRACAALLVPALELLPVHHLGRHQRPALALDLGQVDAADVPRPEPPHEADVRELHRAEPRGEGGWVGARRGDADWPRGGGGGAGGRGGGDGGGGAGALGGAEAEALQLVRRQVRVAVRRHCCGGVVSGAELRRVYCGLDVASAGTGEE